MKSKKKKGELRNFLNIFLPTRDYFQQNLKRSENVDEIVDHISFKLNFCDYSCRYSSLLKRFSTQTFMLKLAKQKY